MNLKPFTGPGSTPSRRRFWDKAVAEVIASQKLAGRFVTIDEHIGQGTVVNVADTSSRRATPSGGATGPCCLDGECTVTTEAECTDMGGEFHPGGVCDPNPCCTDCCDPDSPTITVTFSGVTMCAGIGGDVNGTFVLNNSAPGLWQGNGNDITQDGDTFPTFIEVNCDNPNVGTGLSFAMTSDAGCFQAFAAQGCALGPLSNAPVIACVNGNCGEGGTAIISCPELLSPPP